MLSLLDKTVRTAKWHGRPLPEVTKASVKETLNGDFVLTFTYPITDSKHYQALQEDYLVQCPVPVLEHQLFRIKKVVEGNHSIEVTAYHISEDVMTRLLNPFSCEQQPCATALSNLVMASKTPLGDISLTSDIIKNRTYTADKEQTLYSALLDGKHSIVGTWEGELVRDNLALTIKSSRGQNRGVVISTHYNLKKYERTKESSKVITRIHASSTFKEDGQETETVLKVTVDSPLIGTYPFINEVTYTNNNLKTRQELEEWARTKFRLEGIDKPKDAITIESYELDGQTVHLGDTVTLKSRLHGIDLTQKAVAYDFDPLTLTYRSLTFDDKATVGTSKTSGGLSTLATSIVEGNKRSEDVAVEKALDNANRAFDAAFEKRQAEIETAIQQAESRGEVYADKIRTDIAKNMASLSKRMETHEAENTRMTQEILAKAGANTNLATEANTKAEQAQTGAREALNQATVAKQEAIREAERLTTSVLNQAETKAVTAKTQAIQEASRLVELAKNQLDGQVVSLTTDLSKTKESIKLLASKDTLEALTGRVTSAEATLRVSATEIAQRVKQSDFNQATQRITSAESSITQTAQGVQQLTTRVTESAGKLSTAETKLTQLINDVSSKVSLTDFDKVKQAVQSHSTSISQASTQIALKADKTTTDTINRVTSQLRSDLTVAQTSISQKVSQTDFNAANNRLKTAETTIQTLSGQIATKLTQTDVNRLVDQKGFVTSSTMTNAITQSASGLTNRISQVEGKIPKEGTGNLLKASNKSWTNVNRTTFEVTETLLANRDYTITSHFWGGTGATGHTCSFGDKAPYYTLTYNTTIDSWVVTFRPTQAIPKGSLLYLYSHPAGSMGNGSWVTLTKGTTPLSVWQPNYSELVTEVKFHEVTDTVSSHTRTIGEQNTRISQVVQTAQGLVSRVGNLMDTQNLVYDPTNFSKYKERAANSNLVLTGTNEYKLLRITQSGLTSNGWRGFQIPLHTKKFVQGEKLSYRVNLWVDVLPDDVVGFEIKNGSDILGSFTVRPTKTGAGQIFTGTFTISKTTTTTDDFGLHVWLRKNGQVAVGQLSIVRGEDVPTSFVDSTSAQQLATESVVQQHAGSYAISTLTNAGKILNQLNLNKDGSVKIDGKLVQITGTTYIQDGVISSAKIGSLDAGKITTGFLSSARIGVEAITADKMKVDQAFFNKLTANDAYLRQLFAKSAFINQVQAVTLSATKISGGILAASNGAMRINLNDGSVKFYTNSPSISREVSGYPHQWVAFETGTYDNKPCGVTVIGSNRNNNWNSNDGGFVGIRAWNGPNADQIDVVGDLVRLASSPYNSPDGWDINTLPNRLDIDAHRASDRPSSVLHIGDVRVYRNASSYVSLKDVLQQFNHNFKHLVNITGRGDVILTWDTIK
ncbi:matrix-binding protein EbhB [Streptococcus dysgalactiae subsp. dysgalactiae]|uniref:phage tail spike protein n=1 Tax=Streptococcus dysgalactiae TaxID=1334 RepID=UPI001CF3A26F|nr:phage tail spike protein [Streptococcus dysgalactiae]MCB2837236.1 matrix-binding protein EbhB [Streptococcus dysgalactiae subsp. dysgalactiae]